MAFIPIKQYRIATSTTHAVQAVDTAGYLAAPSGSGGKRQVRVVTKTVDTVLKFGTSAAVEADATLASGALIDGNFFLLAGTIELVDLPHNTTHISAEAVTGTGEIWLTLGYGELI